MARVRDGRVPLHRVAELPAGGGAGAVLDLDGRLEAEGLGQLDALSDDDPFALPEAS